MPKKRKLSHKKSVSVSTSVIINALQQPTQPLLRIDLAKLAANVKFLQNRIGKDCQLMAVIKGNFYGLGDEGEGSVKLVSLLKACGVKVFCVARFDEAIRLRQLNIQDEILILEEMQPEEAIFAAQYYLIPTLTTQEAANALQEIGKNIKVHVKVNTGANLNGVEVDDLLPLLHYIKNNCTYIAVEGLYTHFNNASDDKLYFSQLNLFKHLVNVLEKQEIKPPVLHAANSYTTCFRNEAYFDRVRCGAALYGIIEKPGLSPVCTFITKVTRIRYLKQGECIGYNHHGFDNIMKRDSKLAIIRYGYADGGIVRKYNFDHPPCVIIAGQKAPVINEISMDKLIVDVTDFNVSVKVGDEVTLFDGESLSLQNAAESLNKIPAELLVQLSIYRCAREYVTHLADKSSIVESKQGSYHCR